MVAIATAVWVWCWLRSGMVAVPSKVRVGMGVKVLLGVKVGVAEMSGVAVALGEAVLVGAVCVGKGPSSACAVPASVVLMASMLCPPDPSPNALEPRNVTAYATMIIMMLRTTCSRRFREGFFCLFNLDGIL